MTITNVQVIKNDLFSFTYFLIYFQIKLVTFQSHLLFKKKSIKPIMKVIEII